MSVLVIDGYNVIARGLAKDPGQAMGSEDSRREYREELVRLAKNWCAGRKGTEVRIYFDGTEEGASLELSDRSVKVFFTKGDQGADNAIIKFCRNYPKPKEIEVASDDWGTLGFHIRSQVCKLLSVAELVRRLKPGNAPSGSKSRAGRQEDPPLSDGTRQSINKTLPPSWFR
jgi:predicted RNA-binding protein with PIN domain